MATDIATLGIKVDASEAEQGSLKLEQLAKSGDKAQASTKGLKTTTDALASGLNNAGAASTAAANGVGGFGGKTSAAGAAAAQASGQVASLADRVTRLKASVDPLGVALDRNNDEMREAAALYASGAISAENYARSMALLQARSTELAARQSVLNARMLGGAGAAKLNASEALNLSRQFADIGVTAAMGMNPLMILIQQGPQIADIMKTSGLSVREMGKELLFFFKILERVPAAEAAAATATAASASASTAAAAANTAQAASAVAVARAADEAAEENGQLAFAFMAEANAANASTAANVANAASLRGVGTSADATSTKMVTRLGLIGRMAGPVGLALGSIWLLFEAGTRGANESLRSVQREFGYTDEQMKRLKDSGIELGYTYADVWAGIKAVVVGAIEDMFGTDIWTKISSFWDSILDYVVTGVGQAVQAILSSFLGTYHATMNVWSQLPAAIGDIVIQAANNVINGVESMVNGSVGIINSMIDKIPEWARPDGRVGTVEWGNIDNPNAGAAAGAMEGIREGWREGDEQAAGIVQRAGDRFRRGRSANRASRIAEAAGDPNRERSRRPRAPRQSDEEKEWESAVKAAEEYTKALNRQTEEIGKNELELARLNTTRAQAEIMAQGQAAALAGIAGAMATATRLSNEMATAQEAWEIATVNEHLRVLRETLGDLGDDIAHETSLIGLSNEARERATAQREIDIRLRDLERRGWKITPDLIEAETQAILRNAAARGQRQDIVEAAERSTTAIQDMADAIRDTTESFGELFGTAGQGFADLLNVMGEYDVRRAEAMERQAKLQQELAEGTRTQTSYDFEMGRVSDQLARDRIAQYGDMLGAAKGFFQEGTTGFKLLEAAEKAYRIFQFAMQIKAMFFDKAQTASSVANSGARAAADGVAAIAKAIASLPFPLNIAAGAATAAALVAFGVKVFGGGGGKGKGSATGDAKLSEAAYNGPRDEYGAPTSSYSVLKPGAVTVAASRGGANMGAPAANNNNVGSFRGGDLIIQGGADRRTAEEMQASFQQWSKQTVQDARQAVAADQAANSRRQSIGGS